MSRLDGPQLILTEQGAHLEIEVIVIANDSAREFRSLLRCPDLCRYIGAQLFTHDPVEPCHGREHLAGVSLDAVIHGIHSVTQLIPGGSSVAGIGFEHGPGQVPGDVALRLLRLRFTFAHRRWGHVGWARGCRGQPVAHRDRDGGVQLGR